MRDMQRTPLRLAMAGLLALLASCAPGETAMEQAVLFSAIEGQAIKGGQPLPGAILTREWSFTGDGKRGQDSATTDAQGRFAFPVVIVPYKPARFLAQQPVITQLIKLSTQGDEWRVWVASKHDLLAGTEPVSGPSLGTASSVAIKVAIDLDAPKQLRGGVVGHTIFAGAQ
jgi:hypothetical protein